jgi:predicted unusual protein kinase regulating ubiquinone biosynthesis (AarF/ABC1/UbiB family)
VSTVARVRHLRRYAEIGRLLVKYGRSDLARHILTDEDPLEAGADDGAPADADELARDLEALGPTFIKLGQLLSTRRDLVPGAYADALARLQDAVEPLPLADVYRVIEEQLGISPSDAFERFEDAPLASASLGQVHRARLRNGHEVVVKVQRPGIRGQILSDIQVLSDVAGLLEGHTDLGRRAGLVDLVEQFSSTILDELDYRLEADNLHRLATSLADHDRIIVPLPVRELSGSRVLTMDYVPGRKVTDLTPLGRTDIDGAELATALFSAYLDQILVDGFFHADPHPGNVLLTDDGSLALIDLGMVARVPPRLQDALVELLVGISSGNGEDAALVAVKIGTALDDIDEASFVRGAAALIARSQGRAMDNLDSGTLVMELNRLALSSGLRLPPELALLGKALLNLDEIARRLDPSFDPTACVRERADALLRERLRPSRERMVTAALETREFVEQLPGRLNRFMDALGKGEMTLSVDAIDERQLLEGLHRMVNRLTMGIVLAALVIGAATLTRVQTSSQLFGYPTLAMAFFLLAAGGVAWLCTSILLEGRRQRR